MTGENIEIGTARGQLGYTYDAVGNRLARAVSGPNLGALANAGHLYDADDRLLTDQYDANGNTLQSTLPAPFHFPVADVYDFENRLVRRTVWVEGQPWTIDRFHDGDGRLAAQTVDGATTYYLVDDLNPTGHSQVLEELTLLNHDLAPTLVQTFGHALLHQQTLEIGPDNNLDWQLRFHGTDAHGNVRYLTDPAGTVTDTWDYDAFGNVIDRTGSSDNRHLFAGERWDPNLMLYDLRARLYQPDTGRFWTRDPFPGVRGVPSSLHPYLFAENDPVNRLDPDGQFSALSMSLGVTYGLSLRSIYNGVSLQVGFGLIQTLEGLEAGRSDEQILVDYLLASTRDVALGFGTAYAARALWPALLRVASRPLAALSQTYSRSSAALASWRNGSTLAARELVGVAHWKSGPAAARAAQLEFGFVANAQRQQIARAFYESSGWAWPRVRAHLGGIDFNYPVEVISVPRGTRMVQYSFPGEQVGNYFAAPGTAAGTLGIYPHGRASMNFIANRDVAALRSTASSTVDTWSVPGWDIDVPGGGTQIFVPDNTAFDPYP